MDATLNLYAKLIAFGDRTVNSNPRLRAVDWERDNSGLSVKDPTSKGFEIPVGSSKVIFDGARSTSTDGTTQFSISLLTNTTSSYRITHTSGTNPVFRTGRNLTLNACTVTFAIQPNNIVTLSVPGLSPSDFTNVQANDIIFVPSITTGDSANVINTLNSGYWQVLSKTNAQTLSIARPTGTVFEGVSETVTLTSNSQMRAFNQSGVQIGDSVIVSSGFSVAAQQTFTVSSVTDSFIEFTSTLPLPNETAIVPGASGLSFYTENKRILYIEADQECVIQLNNSTDESVQVNPIEAGNASRPGMFMKTGSVFSLNVINKSGSTLNLLVITAK